MRHLLRPELERQGLTSPMFWALHQLVLDGPLSVGALAGACIVTPANVSAASDPLVAAGLVARSEAARDRRFVVLTATARGRSVHRAVWNHVGQVLLGSLEGVPSADLEATARVLGRLAGAVASPPGEASLVEAA
jgi:DNA-binding MarR family transcriptional regulator